MIRFNFPQYNRLLLVKSLIRWPLSEAITEDTITNLPKSIGEILFNHATKVNTVSINDKRSFLLTSEAENTQTQ